MLFTQILLSLVVLIFSIVMAKAVIRSLTGCFMSRRYRVLSGYSPSLILNIGSLSIFLVMWSMGLYLFIKFCF